jgi:hypothetical protein
MKFEKALKAIIGSEEKDMKIFSGALLAMIIVVQLLFTFIKN